MLELPNHARVLDAGCGDGIISRYARAVRPDAAIYGIDIDDNARKKIPAFVKFYRKSIESTGFRKDYFDAVLCFHVLEHVERPSDAIDEIHRILKPGGLLLMEVPHWVSAITPIGYNFYSDPTHKKPFSKKSLRKLLEKKFFIKQIKFDSPVYFYLKKMSGYRKLLDGLGLYRTVVWAEASKPLAKNKT